MHALHSRFCVRHEVLALGAVAAARRKGLICTLHTVEAVLLGRRPSRLGLCVGHGFRTAVQQRAQVTIVTQSNI